MNNKEDEKTLMLSLVSDQEKALNYLNSGVLPVIVEGDFTEEQRMNLLDSYVRVNDDKKYYYEGLRVDNVTKIIDFDGQTKSVVASKFGGEGDQSVAHNDGLYTVDSGESYLLSQCQETLLNENQKII